MRKPVVSIAALILTAACASTPTVDMSEPRRVVGTEAEVRLDAQIFGERLSTNITIPVKYDITNTRDEAIAVADMVPEASYDPETQVVTVGIGSEVPGASLLPRLISIAPGEKKSFSTVARVNILVGRVGSPLSRYPNALRVKLNFLSDTTPFQHLIGITEKGIQDPNMADQLFPVWLEKNETVYTNAVPMRWGFEPEEVTAPPAGRRRRS